MSLTNLNGNDMALVGITEAARLVGVSEKTIRRKVASGDMSVQVTGYAGQARKVIDTSELLRVFGSLPGQAPVTVQATSPDMSTQWVDIRGQHGHGLTQVIETQQVLIGVLQDQLDARTEENRELRGQVTGLLEWRKPDPAPPSALVAVASVPVVRLDIAVGVAIVGSLVVSAWAWADGYRLWFLI